MSCELEVWTFGSSDSQIYCLPIKPMRELPFSELTGKCSCCAEGMEWCLMGYQMLLGTEQI